MKTQIERESANVLIVEDNPVDQRIACQLFRAEKWVGTVRAVASGEEALLLLKQKNSPGALPRPDLIILDLDLPAKNGQEILREIREDRELSTISVVVLSASTSGRVLAEAYKLGADCYLTKPNRPQGFRELVRRAEHCWYAKSHRGKNWFRDLFKLFRRRPLEV